MNYNFEETILVRCNHDATTHWQADLEVPQDMGGIY